MRAADRRRQDREESRKQVVERRAHGDPRAPMTPENVLALQRSVGNRALARAIAEAAPAAKGGASRKVVARYRSPWDRIAALPGAIEYQISHRMETRRKIRTDARIEKLEEKGKRAAAHGHPREAEALRAEARKLRSKRQAEEDWYVRGEEYPQPPQREPKYEPPEWEFGDDD